MAWWPSIDAGQGFDLLAGGDGGHPRRITSILCAVDRRAWQADVVDVAADAAFANNARLTLMAVVRRPSPWVAMAGHTAAGVLDAAEREALDGLANALALVPPAVTCGAVLRIGSPATAITAEVLDGDHDLIVLGRRPHRGLARWTSVSRRVAARSDRMVVTVPVR
jgi:nucleotide-binding universal stress UspA family protein